jgi:hypothetical protein
LIFFVRDLPLHKAREYVKQYNSADGSLACALISIDTKANKPIKRCSRGNDGTFRLPFELRMKKL